ncbi:dTMP kinase [Brevibacillus ginsengisoli]|uniref:dTMP kinase n=1 Tax=Brevibacillus ginsengisoli TaxID=363854 RepID=UPI003CF49235
MNGLFITFEGPDGAGKTTQVQKFAEQLIQQGYDVLLTREPGGTPISDQVRELVLSPSHPEMHDHTEVLLYAASRSQHVHEKVIPALKSGKIVVCDRFVDASIAYQGYGLGIPVEEVERINRFATSGLVPNRTYMLDVPVTEGKARLLARSGLDRIEQKGEAYHERVREGFRKLAAQHPERIQVINACRSIETIAHEILTDFTDWLCHNK